MITRFCAALAAIFLLLGTSLSVAGDWRQSWTDVKSDAAKRCADTFPEFQLQAVCMQNEKKGYDQMQGNFGLPPDVADKAKLRCADTFPEFQLQAVCMQNEKKGYDQMKQY